MNRALRPNGKKQKLQTQISLETLTQHDLGF